MAALLTRTVNTELVKKAWLRWDGDEWSRLPVLDEQRLDDAMATGSACVPCKCPMRGGRYEARLNTTGEEWAGVIAPRYEEKAVKLLAHGRWCYFQGGKWTPFTSADDHALEVRLQALVRLQQISREHEKSFQQIRREQTHELSRERLDDSAREEVEAEAASFSQKAPAPVATRDGFHVHLSAAGKNGVRVEVMRMDGDAVNLSPSITVARGWAGHVDASLPIEEETVERQPPCALVLVIHGIGEALWRQPDNPFKKQGIDKSVDILRALSAKVYYAHPRCGTIQSCRAWHSALGSRHFCTSFLALSTEHLSAEH